MLISALHSFLFTPATKQPRSRLVFWLALSLTFSLVYYIPAFQQVISQPYLVQDDARQHVFWMMRFSDPDLFPNDLLADYFQSVAPLGYTTLYRLFAAAGIDALLLHKLLPPLLLLISTAYGFALCLQLLAVPLAGFLFTLMLNQSFWMRDDIISATPAAFVYPIFLAFLYYLVRGQRLPCLVTIALQGLFYPQCMLVFCGVLLLRLLRWQQGRIWLSGDRRDYWFCASGLAVALLVLLPYFFRSSEFGPVVTAAEAKTIATFGEDKWSEFFPRWTYPLSFLRKYWICGRRAGLMPPEWCGVDYGPLNAISPLKAEVVRVSFGLPQIIFGALLPVLLYGPDRFRWIRSVRRSASQQLSHHVAVIWQTLLASLLLFAAAHLLLFKLHLPSRYTEHTLRLLAPLAAAIALTLLLDCGWRACLEAGQSARRPLLALSATILLLAGLLLYPQFLRLRETPFPIINYAVGQYPKLYEFFAKQPKDTVIASIALEANNLPSFTQRSLVVGGEGYTLPYHLGYYREVVQRTQDLVTAQYSDNPDVVNAFIQRYKVNFWLIEYNAFKPGYAKVNPTLAEFDPLGARVRTQLLNDQVPVLSRLSRECQVLRTGRFRVISAECILEQAE